MLCARVQQHVRATLFAVALGDTRTLRWELLIVRLNKKRRRANMTFHVAVDKRILQAKENLENDLAAILNAYR